MPVTYNIDQIHKIIRTNCIGNVTLEEVLDHFHMLERDPDVPASLDVLLDLTQTTSLPESDQLRAITGEISRIQRKMVRFDACAIVASSDALYGMARMFAVFAADYIRSARVFRELDQAETWLESQLSRSGKKES
jgi:SpoIIAA-like